MTITEFAILVFKSPPNFSDPTLQSLFQKLSTWQSECSGFPLLFFTNPDDSHQIHLVTGWTSGAAHEAWIRGERNQELLRVFGPYVDMPKIRMVHIDVDFEAVPKDAGGMVVERYDRESLRKRTHFQSEMSDRLMWLLSGRDLAQGDGGDMFRIAGSARESSGVRVRAVLAPVEQWILKRVEM